MSDGTQADPRCLGVSSRLGGGLEGARARSNSGVELLIIVDLLALGGGLAAAVDQEEDEQTDQKEATENTKGDASLGPGARTLVAALVRS